MQKGAEAEIKAALGADENLLWSGQPKQGIIFRFFEIYMIPMAIFCLALAVFWTVLVFGPIEDSKLRVLMIIFGIPLEVFIVLVALYLVCGRYILDAKMREKTSYYLTTQRIMIVRGFTKRNVKSFKLRELHDISLKREGTRGTISFGREGYGWYWVAWHGIWEGFVPRFDLIENPKQVYDLVMETKKKDDVVST